MDPSKAGREKKGEKKSKDAPNTVPKPGKS